MWAALVEYGRLRTPVVASARTPGKHFAQASVTTMRRMTVVRQIGRAVREEDDANGSPTALAVGASLPVALFRRARADRRGERVALSAGSLAEPAGQAHRSA